MLTYLWLTPFFLIAGFAVYGVSQVGRSGERVQVNAGLAFTPDLNAAEAEGERVDLNAEEGERGPSAAHPAHRALREGGGSR
jgi:hypothetical protein